MGKGGKAVSTLAPFDKGAKFSADAKQAERSLKGKGDGVG